MSIKTFANRALHSASFLCIFLFSAAAAAEPIVQGSVISWPDDGYYQVQRATDFETVCEDVRQCAVDAGEYIVINHTTQQRFERIVVGSTSQDDGYQLLDNTFVFSEEYWFQVQDAQTYQSICNGASRCEVEAGRYVVINHSLQQRFDDVLVGTPETPDTTYSVPSVNGNVISWSNNGWYQVQNAENYDTLCEGGNECVVPAGTYHVINLTSNTRYENIVVPGAVTPEPPDTGSDPNTIPSQRNYFPPSISASDATAFVSDNQPDQNLPEAATPIGDINGDGLEDILIIIDGQVSYQTSAAVLFADASGHYPDLPLTENLNTDTGENLAHGFLINDVGSNIVGVGDINNDGFDDLSLISSGYFESPLRFVIAGSPSFPSRINTDDFSEEQIIVQLPISATLVNAGDVNGDSIADLLITAPTDVRGGVIYGGDALNVVVESRQELRDRNLFPGCIRDFCRVEPIGDFDGDGIDDLYASRFGANDCGFSDYALVLYGQMGGIETADTIYNYPASAVTRIVDEQGGDCFSGFIIPELSGNDIDGDGQTDLFFRSRLGSEVNNLVFGMNDRRRGFISMAELDGQLGLSVIDDGEVEVRDINDDGFDDILFDNGYGYLGFARNIDSVDAPTVCRTPNSFIINVADNLTQGTDRLLVSVNDVNAGEFASDAIDIVIDDLTAGVQATVVVQLISGDNNIIRTVRRVVPAYTRTENLNAVLLAPRLIELTFNGDALIRRYSHYLVWRNGVAIGRSINGADNYVDQDVELGQNYTYFITPDYLYDSSLNSELVRQSPLLQWQSNSVIISTPGE